MKKSNAFFLLVSLWAGFTFGMESDSQRQVDTDSEYEDERTTDNSDNLQKIPVVEKALSLKDLFHRIANYGKVSDKPIKIKSHSFLYKPTDSEKKLFHKIINECSINEIKGILKQENNPECFSVRTNVLLLVGIPGVGKTTLAKAIACELGNCFFITSGDLLKENRNGTSVRLKNLINSILTERGKNILVLDEINKLLENYTSEYKDSSETASTLWEILDAQQDNPDFFLISTANESKKLPIQIQDRIGLSVVGIERPNDQERKLFILELLSKVKMTRHETLARYIDQLVEYTRNYTPRDLIHLLNAAERKARLFNKKNPTLRPSIFEEVLRIRFVKYQTFWDATLPVSIEERQHREMLNQIEELQNESNNVQRGLNHANNQLQNQLHRQNLESQETIHTASNTAQRQLHIENLNSQNAKHTQTLQFQRQQNQDNKELQLKLAEFNNFVQTECNTEGLYLTSYKYKRHQQNADMNKIIGHFDQLFPNKRLARYNAAQCNCDLCKK